MMNLKIHNEAKLFQKHMDSRTRCEIFRKCCSMLGEIECKTCKDRPVKATEALKVLPAKTAGGLFFDPVPDENHPGHFKTFLEVMKDKLKVVPDEQLEDVKKCNVDKCLNVFKNHTDAERHNRIFHADPRLRKRIAEMFGYVCGFK